MRFDYIPFTTVSVTGSLVQYRPLIPVRLQGPLGWSMPLSCILSCGSDVTVFSEVEASLLGIDLTGIPIETALTDISLGIPYQPARVRIKITDPFGETCEWPTTVGFTSFPLDCPLLGHRGFLEYFDTKLLGALNEVVLDPNASFQGSHLLPSQTP